ncbi:MAG: hypothetical protein DLM57_18730 [Pseudonocardiales bacterium]|nr:MAG: hypothetical protein DLM57_18730 [Pseudonocardiales bacterium]
MWKKIAIAGGVCAAVAGIGTAAVATSGSSAPSGASAPSGSPSSTAKHAGKHGDSGLRHALHGQWVTPGKDGKGFVTHDAIRGTVMAVTPTSITVQASDKVSQTFTVSGDTKVRMRADKKGAKGTKGTIAQVHTGDKALVIGTGTTTLAANGILDAGK